jgi:hypothetical protein
MYRPLKVQKALIWLQINNHLYKDISLIFPEEWSHITDDEEFVDIPTINVTEEDRTYLEHIEEELPDARQIATNTGNYIT